MSRPVPGVLAGHIFCQRPADGDNWPLKSLAFFGRPSRRKACVIYLRLFKRTPRNPNDMSERSHSGVEVDVMRTWIAISFMMAFGLFTAFAITMAASYAINERCTEQMAWDGNC